MDVIELGDQHALEQGLAGMRGDVPPSFGRPAFRVLIADGDADPARGGVAELEIGLGRARAEGSAGRGEHEDRDRASPGGQGCDKQALAGRPGRRKTKHHPASKSRLVARKYWRVASNWLRLSDRRTRL